MKFGVYTWYMSKYNLIWIGQPDQLIDLFKKIFFDDLHLQIIERISPKASVYNSAAQWAILILLLAPSSTGGGGGPIIKSFFVG